MIGTIATVDHHVNFTHIKIHIISTTKSSDQNSARHFTLGLDDQGRYK